MIYDSSQWKEDIDRVIETIPELHSIAGKKILITGASGLIGSAIVDILFRYNDTNQLPIQILGAGRSIRKMADRFGEMIDRDDFSFLEYDASKSSRICLCADYIIHGASNASPDMIIKEPVETMLSNFLGVKYLLDHAKAACVKRLLFISSSEVYGQQFSDEPFEENQYGAIDPLMPRNSYSIAKCAAETMCVSYAQEYGIDSVIVRPGHVYGPTASPHDRRVSSAWAYSAAKGENIVMKSEGKQIRSYIYCLDCASAILKVLLRGEKCRAYNIANPNSIINIKQLGMILAQVGNVQLKMELPTEEDKKGFNPMLNSSLSSSSLEKLGWHGCFDPEEGLAHTVEILKEQCLESAVH